jgi:hypothetical protein
MVQYARRTPPCFIGTPFGLAADYFANRLKSQSSSATPCRQTPAAEGANTEATTDTVAWMQRSG